MINSFAGLDLNQKEALKKELVNTSKFLTNKERQLTTELIKVRVKSTLYSEVIKELNDSIVNSIVKEEV
ncbi:MAG: hypothetical protein MR510_08690 [Clostridium sp.]|uniref:hypothetical protein n=1 Tax=Clostridium sp. TaxID=1506 RepID=UPI002A841239|nr:hypothetical protein [Clostridium sp.]MCI6692539.1 hypothetical protein [Clostridium sp.]MDY4252570.1 hypothetical protein [Clostridium sp.]